MIDLYKYYFENIKEEEYYYRFYKRISNEIKKHNVFSSFVEIEKLDFILFDDEELIEKFRNLCQPQFPIDSQENQSWFYLICYYLHKNGYFIEQFPNMLRRPPEIPSNFSVDEIRTYLINKGIHRNGTVQYSDRRVFVANLVFKQNIESVEVGIDIDNMFQKISTRQASFQQMSTDEKIKEIINLIEYMLKGDKGYSTFDYSNVAFDYIDESLIKKYKKHVQCFRHASETSIKERENFTENQKEFMIDLGITILKVIHNIIRKDK